MGYPQSPIKSKKGEHIRQRIVDKPFRLNFEEDEKLKKLAKLSKLSERTLITSLLKIQLLEKHNQKIFI
jgi:hypothetical protein